MMRRFIIILSLLTLANLHASILLDFNHYNSRFYGSGESILIEKKDLNNIDIFPASIASIQGQMLSLGYIKWLDLLSIMRAAYAHNLGTYGVIGGSFNFASLNASENYDPYGNLLDKLKINDILFNIGYGKKINNNIQMGINFKYLNINLHDYQSKWMGAGYSGMISLPVKGINVKTKNNFNIGIGIQDINLISSKFKEKKSTYPMKIYSGIVYKFLQWRDMELKIGTTSTYLTKYKNFYLSSGIELGYKQLLYLRSGYYILGRQSDKLAAGVGIGKDSLFTTKLLGHTGIKFDYSFSLLNDGISHFAQLSLVFKPEYNSKKKYINYYEDKNIIIQEEANKKQELVFHIKEKNKKLFKPNKSDLDDKGEEILIHIAKLIKKEDYKKVLTIIHVKKDKKAINLSEKRAQIILNYFKENGINPKRMDYKLYNKIQGLDEIGNLKYKFLLIRWGEEEKEKFKEHYFNGLDAYIKGGYNIAINEWEKALELDPGNQDLQTRLSKAKKAEKRKDNNREISVKIRTQKEILKIKKADTIRTVIFDYENIENSSKWKFLKNTIPDAIYSSLNDNDFVKVIDKEQFNHFIDEKEIDDREILQNIRKNLKADILIKGNFVEQNHELKITTIILDLESGYPFSIIEITGKVGVNMFDLMDKTTDVIMEILARYKE